VVIGAPQHGAAAPNRGRKRVGPTGGACGRDCPRGWIMARAGWLKLIPREGGFRGSGAFRIDAYSAYVPPPPVGWKPYGPAPVNSQLFAPDDPFGWKVHEFDEALELQPGLHQIARQLLARLRQLQEGNPEAGLPRHVSENNPFWPPELAAANLGNDPCVL